MALDDSCTLNLLQRWHQGEPGALSQLLERNLPFIRNYLRQRLGPQLRGKAESMDFVQDAMVEFLRYGPRFVINGEASFRALMARILENVMRDKHDWFTARRRDLARERPMPMQSVLGLDPSLRSTTQPGDAAHRNEEEGWIRLAMELLEPPDREVIHLRIFDQAPFSTIGEHFGVNKIAARARFLRALPRLAKIVSDLRAGRLENVLNPTPLDTPPHE